jgi:uncharacterized membrane protein SpoIIM required for sporulation
MTETAFLHKNKKRWLRFEEVVGASGVQQPDLLAEVFLQLTDDLAYSRTHFPQAQVTDYLNQLTAQFYTLIYKNKQEKKNRFASFWLKEVPLLYYQNRRFVLYALLLFLAGMLVGALSSANDGTYVRLILGEAYVNMTLDNIDQGDPMAVYKKMQSSEMFFSITFNNVRVSLLAFVAGVCYSIGSGFVLFSNAIMVGAFQYFFYERGLFLTSFLTIWIHGTLEISAIVLAGGAGFTMGHRLLFPKTYSRITALKQGAREGLKMVVGLVPVFVVAGFLESYVTRLTNMPLLLKILIIGLSATFILFYFVFYPRRVNRQEYA